MTNELWRVAPILLMKKPNSEECRLKLIVHFTELLFYISIKTLLFRFKPMHKSIKRSIVKYIELIEQQLERNLDTI